MQIPQKPSLSSFELWWSKHSWHSSKSSRVFVFFLQATEHDSAGYRSWGRFLWLVSLPECSEGYPMTWGVEHSEQKHRQGSEESFRDLWSDRMQSQGLRQKRFSWILKFLPHLLLLRYKDSNVYTRGEWLGISTVFAHLQIRWHSPVTWFSAWLLSQNSLEWIHR